MNTSFRDTLQLDTVLVRALEGQDFPLRTFLGSRWSCLQGQSAGTWGSRAEVDSGRGGENMLTEGTSPLPQPHSSVHSAPLPHPYPPSPPHPSPLPTPPTPALISSVLSVRSQMSCPNLLSQFTLYSVSGDGLSASPFPLLLWLSVSLSPEGGSPGSLIQGTLCLEQCTDFKKNLVRLRSWVHLTTETIRQ